MIPSGKIAIGWFFLRVMRCRAYAVLAQRGFFEPAILDTLRRTGSMLQGHPDMCKTPGVNMLTGSLGMGISAGIGMALARVLPERPFGSTCWWAMASFEKGRIGKPWRRLASLHSGALWSSLTVTVFS